MMRSIHQGFRGALRATQMGLLTLAVCGLSLLGAAPSQAASGGKSNAPRPVASKAKPDKAKSDKPAVEATGPITVAGKGVTSIEAGRARAERLGAIYTDGVGPFVAARAGDWRLSNEFVSLTFAAVDPKPAKVSQPVAGPRTEKAEAAERLPGAMIDVAVDGETFDTLGIFTQGIGTDVKDPLVPYDTVRLVKRGNEVGLRLEGSPFEVSTLRVQTTYWLAGGSHRVRIESEVDGLPEGEPVPKISDVGHWGAGLLLLENQGLVGSAKGDRMAGNYYMEHGGRINMGLAPVEGVADGLFFQSPPASRVTYHPQVKKEDKNTSGSAAKPVAALNQPISGAPTKMVRDFWLARGHFADMTKLIVNDRKIPSGVLSGQVTIANTKKPDPNVYIRFERLDLEHLEKKPLYTVASVDQNGRYKVELPVGHYFVRPESNVVPGGARLMVDCNIETGKPQIRDLHSFPESGVRVKVVDAKTSKPLAAHLYFEAIKPSVPLDLGFPLSARGYMNYAYIPAGETQLPLPPGRWMVYATHGPRYERGELEVNIVREKVSNCTFALQEESPTPGWVGVELGARTKATPGCNIEPEDMVLMAVGEGLEWIVSGDFNTVTDFGPAIKKLGLTGTLGSSRGFRTLSTAHPEWGQFLIYPLSVDAPDPAKTHGDWDKLDSAKDFIAALRRFYPAALIQSEQPFTKDGQGYFGVEGENIYQIAYTPNPKLSLDLDAVNLFPARRPWNMTDLMAFWYAHMIQGRFYLGSTSSTGRCVLGGEPGYPRLLVLVGKNGLAGLSEEALFKAIRAHKTQLSSGPFIDYSLGGVAPGGLVGLNEDAKVQLRITAPIWINVNHYSVDKDGIMLVWRNFSGDQIQPQRYPPPDSEEEVSIQTLKDLHPLKFKDTLAAVRVIGRGALKPMLPAVEQSEDVIPMAVTSPIIVDANGNKKYDPLKNFIDLGR